MLFLPPTRSASSLRCGRSARLRGPLRVPLRSAAGRSPRPSADSACGRFAASGGLRAPRAPVGARCRATQERLRRPRRASLRGCGRLRRLRRPLTASGFATSCCCSIAAALALRPCWASGLSASAPRRVGRSPAGPARARARRAVARPVPVPRPPGAAGGPAAPGPRHCRRAALRAGPLSAPALGPGRPGRGRARMRRPLLGRTAAGAPWPRPGRPAGRRWAPGGLWRPP